MRSSAKRRRTSGSSASASSSTQFCTGANTPHDPHVTCESTKQADRRYDFRVGVGGVQHDGIYEAGEVICFSSSLYHRVELLANGDCEMLSINVRGNVLLGRRLKNPHSA